MSVPDLLSSPFSPPGSAAQPFSPFWFTAEPRDTLVFRGSSALLNCSAHSDASTPARVEWKKDGTFMSLLSDERRRILPDGSLLFTHVVHSKHNKPDEGTYQCVATIESLGSISSRTARLSVAGEPLSTRADTQTCSCGSSSIGLNEADGGSQYFPFWQSL